MVWKILITDPDWNLLSIAYRTLAKHGYELVDEASPARALSIAVRWRPDIIIAPPQCIADWRERTAGQDGLNFNKFPAASILVTFNENDDPAEWQTWTSAGHTILIKPIEHPSQLVAAVEEAAETLKNAGRSQAV